MDSEDQIDSPETPPKKYKRNSKIFVDQWLTSNEFKGWLEKVPDITKARCKACNVLIK